MLEKLSQHIKFTYQRIDLRTNGVLRITARNKDIDWQLSDKSGEVPLYRQSKKTQDNLWAIFKWRQTMTAFDLCGVYKDQAFRLKRGRVVWESITYKGSCDKCYISRIVTKGGKPMLMGLKYQSRYINPDTTIIVVNN